MIELSQKMQTLTAYGKEILHAMCAYDISRPGLRKPMQLGKAEDGEKRSADGSNDNRGPSTFRVLSQRLLYSDAERKATFSDHVEAISSSGNVFADRAEVFLTPANVHSQARRSGCVRRKNGEIKPRLTATIPRNPPLKGLWPQDMWWWSSRGDAEPVRDWCIRRVTGSLC